MTAQAEYKLWQEIRDRITLTWGFPPNASDMRKIAPVLESGLCVVTWRGPAHPISGGEAWWETYWGTINRSDLCK